MATSVPHVNSVHRLIREELGGIDSRNPESQINFDRTKRVGWGSFGDVYLGEYLGKDVCVKVLREVQVTDNELWGKFVRRLTREMKVWCGLTHPNVVSFLGWMSEVHDEYLCVSLISTWCGGGNVKEYLRRNPDAGRRPLVCDLSRGLEYLHSVEVVHGDVKPANVVISLRTSPIAMLCDFGLSSILSDISTYAQGSSTTGTLRFASPELLLGDLSHRNKGSDIWAFGCTSSEIMRDEQPYSWVRMDMQLHFVAVTSLPYVWDDPDDFEKGIALCLARHPDERPSMGEVSNFLHQNMPFVGFRYHGEPLASSQPDAPLSQCGTRKPAVPNSLISILNPDPSQLSTASHLYKATAEGGSQVQQQHLSQQATQVAQATSGTSSSHIPMHTNGALHAQTGHIPTWPATTQPPVSSVPRAPAAQTATSMLQQSQSQVSPSQPLDNTTAQIQQLQQVQLFQQHQKSTSSGSAPTIQTPVLDPWRVVTHGSSAGKGANQNPALSGSQPQAGAHPSEAVGQTVSGERWAGVVHFHAYDNSKRELEDFRTLVFARSFTRTLEEAGVDSWPQTLRSTLESFRLGSIEEMRTIIKVRNAPLVGFYPARQMTTRLDLDSNERIYMMLYKIMHQQGLVCVIPLQFRGQGSNRGIILFPVPTFDSSEAPKIYGVVFVTEELPRWSGIPALGPVPRPPQPPQLEVTTSQKAQQPMSNPTLSPASAASQLQQFQRLAALSRAHVRQLHQAQQPPNAVGASVPNVQQGDPVGLGLPSPASGVANALGFGPAASFYAPETAAATSSNQLQSQPQHPAMRAYSIMQDTHPEFLPRQSQQALIAQGNQLLAGQRQASNSNLSIPEVMQPWLPQGKPGGTGAALNPGR